MKPDNDEEHIRSINKIIVMLSVLEHGNEYIMEICENKYDKFGPDDLVNLYQTSGN